MPISHQSLKPKHSARAPHRLGARAPAVRSDADKLVVGGELVLYGVVGDAFFAADSFTARDVLDALSTLDGDITVRINSGGGSVFEGLAIYNSLAAHKGNVTVKVDGIAASAASVIAMAGDTIIVPASATVMIHDAWVLTVGNETDHVETAKVLGKIDGQLADIYAKRTGLKRAEIVRMMDDETWMDGNDAVAKGFADSVSDDQAAPLAAFQYNRYRHAPAAVLAAQQPSKPRNEREFERALRKLGFSKSASRALVARGWKDRAPAGHDQARRAREYAELAALVRRSTETLRSLWQ